MGDSNYESRLRERESIVMREGIRSGLRDRAAAPIVERSGVDSSFERFYAAEYQKVFACSYAWSGDREIALDATQEAFSRALARWHRLRSHSWAGGWVITTALNLCRRQRSLSNRERSTVSHEGEVKPADGVRLDLLRALTQLPPRQRRAAILFYVGDYPLRAVADAMDISEGAVKAHLGKARDRLRGLLGAAYLDSANTEKQGDGGKR